MHRIYTEDYFKNAGHGHEPGRLFSPCRGLITRKASGIIQTRVFVFREIYPFRDNSKPGGPDAASKGLGSPRRKPACGRHPGETLEVPAPGYFSKGCIFILLSALGFSSSLFRS
ncbi:hypothetical protein [Desulfovibrio sp.]|uniref:hypothetical protein n=1 Tax=Desulfovibrio sp. TaxID=885 RepID=UPI0039E2A108